MDKQQVIDTYIDRNNKKGILGFLGINKMLGVDDAMKKYLNGEINTDIKSSNGIGDFFKNSILINLFLKDKKNELDKLKDFLDIHKDSQTELSKLAEEIKKGTSIEKAITPDEKPSNQENNNVLTETNNIRNGIDINGNFAKIKEVKNSGGKTILECTGESPYINTDALDDLLGFAQEFYQKTGNSLTLSSAYRTIEQQKKLKSEKGDLAATPGESGHNLGLSIDLDGGDRHSSQVGGINGIRDLAKKYNFYPLASEDRHFDHKTLPDPGNRLAQAQTLDSYFQDKNLA